MNALINVCAPPNRVECPTRVCSGSALLMCVCVSDGAGLSNPPVVREFHSTVGMLWWLPCARARSYLVSQSGCCCRCALIWPRLILHTGRGRGHGTACIRLYHRRGDLISHIARSTSNWTAHSFGGAKLFARLPSIFVA